MSLRMIRTGLLIDGHGGKPRQNVTIHLGEGRITAIEEGHRDSQGLDARNMTVLPGLIDTHVHLHMDPLLPWTTGNQDREEILILKAASFMQEALATGVTTMRDCGNTGVVPFILRDVIERGIIPGPRLLISGPPITTTAGHCYYFGLEADGETEIRKAVRALVKGGVDFIKIMATGGNLTPGSNPRRAQYSLGELKAAVDDAHRLGRRVAAHALATEGILDCALAGVDTIEHCAWFEEGGTFRYDERAVELMVEKGIYVNPCFPAMYQFLSRQPMDVQERERIKEGRLELLRRAYQQGVKMIAGTDGGCPQVGFDLLPLGVRLLNEYLGVSPMEALQGATKHAAEALDLTDVGTIAPGNKADILIVEGNPLEDWQALERPVWVIKEGRILWEKGG